MATSRLLALFAFLACVAFYAAFIIKVPRLDLTIVIAIGLVLVVCDLWTQLVRRR